MRPFVAVTDYEWFTLHASKEKVEEVNFWRPQSEAKFKALTRGEFLLFELHSPENFIAGDSRCPHRTMAMPSTENLEYRAYNVVR